MLTDKARIQRKAFELALQYAFSGILMDLCKRDRLCKPEIDRGMDEFYELALAKLGFAEREIDDELIAEAIPKLREREVDFDEMVRIVEEEMEEDQTSN